MSKCMFRGAVEIGSCFFFLIPDETSQCLFIANPAQEIRMTENDRIECIDSDLQLRMMLIM